MAGALCGLLIAACTKNEKNYAENDVIFKNLDTSVKPGDDFFKYANGGWLKKNPDKQPSSFQLGNTYRFQAPVWYLVWGDQKSGYVAYVDANTGKVLNKK